jgi:cytoskeleton protein RodZ
MTEEVIVPANGQSEMDGVPVLTADADVVSATGAAMPDAEAAVVVLSVGQQLCAAREEKGITATDVAKALKLSANQVLSLEADDWSRLPVTIIRGFVRNYARLLKLDPEPLMLQLTAVQMPPSPKLDLPTESSAALPESGKAERRDYAAVFFGLFLVLASVLAYFFVPDDFWQSKLVALTAGEKSSAPSSVSSALSGNTDAAAAQSDAKTPAAGAEPVTSPDKNAAPQPVQDAASGGVSSGLKLSFAQPSWVEIRDRSGQIIFSQLNPAGSQRDIEGQPPFALVIGNASNVTVQYKGKLIELGQRSKDDVARLNLD